MDSKPKNVLPAIGASSQQVQAVVRRVFSIRSEDSPAPVFANTIEFTGMGMDVLMDVGVVSPESIQSAMGATGQLLEPIVVDFNVSCRYAMTIQTAVLLRQKLNELLEGAKTQLDATISASAGSSREAKK